MKHGGDMYRNLVNLDFSVNINPLGIPERVREALTQAVSECTHYPDMEAEALLQAIGRMTGVSTEHIVCGNGASELFVALMHALKPEKILISVPSFLGYEKAAAASGAEVRYYHMSEENDFSPGIIASSSSPLKNLFLCSNIATPFFSSYDLTTATIV